MKKKPVYTDPYQLDGRIPIGEAIPLGLQHVLAMFVGNLSPLLIIMGTCGITDGNGFGDLRVTLLQNVVLSIGLSLIPVGVNFFCGGSNAPDFGHMWNLFLGLLPKEES